MEHEEIMPDNDGEKDKEGREDVARPKIIVRDNLEVVTEELDRQEKRFNEERGIDHNSTK